MAALPGQILVEPASRFDGFALVKQSFHSRRQPLLLIAGFATGILIGLTGVGAGSLMTPLLMLVFGVAPATVIGTDLCFAALTKIGAMRLHHHAGLIEWQVLKRLWWGSIPATLLALLSLGMGQHRFQENTLKAAVAAALLLTTVGIVFQSRLHRFMSDRIGGDIERFLRTQAFLTVLLGAALGLMVTYTSIGAGAVGAVVLACLYPFRLTPARLIATDIAHAVPLTALAGAGHVLVGHVDFVLLGWLLCGSLPGVLIGAGLSSRLPQYILRVALATVLAIIALRLLYSLGQG